MLASPAALGLQFEGLTVNRSQTVDLREFETPHLENSPEVSKLSKTR